jgi:hypothetical protein
MFSVHQHWDPLKVCAVGRSYSPEFYSFITNAQIRKTLEQIAQETEEDYQKLITLLKSFNVEIVRPNISNNYLDYLDNGKILPPPMVPRDFMTMVGNQFYVDRTSIEEWRLFDGNGWPEIKNDTKNFEHTWKPVIDLVSNQHNKVIYNQGVNGATLTKIGKDLFLGTSRPRPNWELPGIQKEFQSKFSDYRCHVVNTGGHSDGVFCPVCPGLIISLHDIKTYSDTFPDWEVVYLPGQSWDKVDAFLKLKKQNQGKWWVPGQELNSDFTNFVETWLSHWVGYVEETVFDVNMLVIDQHNVVCNNYNKQVFDAFKKFNITPHIVNFRHRYFWDGGIHCITLDLDRDGVQQDYFPER